MSIYDDHFNEDSPKPPVRPSEDQPAAPPPKPPADATLAGTHEDEPETGGRRGCGCGSCCLAVFLTGVLCVALCGIAGFIGYKRAPGWAHDAIVAAVNDSDLKAEDKVAVEAQMDRLLEAYKAGKISGERIGSALEELAESPVVVLIMAYAAMESYVKPSGLSDDEKIEAKRAFQRVARGAFDKSIENDDLETALDYISSKDFNGNRQMKSKVSDEDLRALVKECQRVADEADIPDEAYEVDVAAEVERIVDRALGIEPEEDEDVATDSGSGGSDSDETSPTETPSPAEAPLPAEAPPPAEARPPAEAPSSPAEAPLLEA